MLTDIQIKNAKAKKKVWYLPDFDSLRLAIYPTGRKTWQHRFRMKAKPYIRTAADYPIMSIKEARAWRDNNNELRSQGITPPKKYDSIKQVSSDIPTFKEMFDEWHKFKSRECSICGTRLCQSNGQMIMQLIPSKEEICIYSLNLVSCLCLQSRLD